MKKLSVWMVTAVLAAMLAGPAFAGSCPLLWKQVDQKLATMQVAPDVLKKVKALRAKGEADHKAGKHAASEAALREALALLGS